MQEQEFNPLPTEFQLTPFEMLMQDIRARNYKLRKVMVSCWGRQLAPEPSARSWLCSLRSVRWLLSGYSDVHRQMRP